MDTTALTALTHYRVDVYAAFGRRRDALFALCDTLLGTGTISSFPSLSLQPQHQCGWGSLFGALREGDIDMATMERLLTAHPQVTGESI